MNKKLIIINGVMGVIGSPLFSYLVETGNYIIWGISRKGRYYEEYFTEEGKLPLTNMVFSVTDYNAQDTHVVINSFIESIPDAEIIFIHTMGKFVTEMDKEGKIIITDDDDGDGINDEVRRLSYEVPLLFCKELIRRGIPVTFVQIGSLSDEHNIDLHGSWVKSMQLLKERLIQLSRGHGFFNALILNVSSVLTPKELIDRPFVSLQTNADMRYWLPPIEIAKYISEYAQTPVHGYFEKNLYKSWPNFSQDHFQKETYKERRINELYEKPDHIHKEILDLSEGESIAYTFQDPFHMDKVWGDIALLLVPKSRGKTIVFYNTHEWFFVVRNRTERELFASIEKDGGTVSLICARENPINMQTLASEFKSSIHSYKFDRKTHFANNYNLNIFGDFIVEVFIDKATARKIDMFYKTYLEITPENIKELKDIVSQKGNNRLVVSLNAQRSDHLRNDLL